MTGDDSIEDANNLFQLISQESKKGGVHFKKWISNSLKIMQNVEDTEDNKVLTLVESESVRAMGV